MSVFQFTVTKDLLDQAHACPEAYDELRLQSSSHPLEVSWCKTTMVAAITAPRFRAWLPFLASTLGFPMFSMMYQDFRGGRCDGLRAHSVNFQDATFEGVSVQGAEFLNCNFTDASFEHADLWGASFVNCTLEGCNFYGARRSPQDEEIPGYRLEGNFLVRA